MDVCIIYESDASDWAGHFEGQFRNAKTTSTVLKVEDVLPIPSLQTTSLIDDAKVIMIIVSEGMLNFLIRKKGTSFSSCLKDIKKGVLFYLSVYDEDIRSSNLQSQFPDYDSKEWTKLSYGEGNDPQELQNSISTILRLVEDNTVNDENDDPIGQAALNEPEEDQNKASFMKDLNKALSKRCK